MDKDEVAKQLIERHFSVDPDLVEVYRLVAHDEAPGDPIKLLEVTTSTIETGELEAFGFAPTADVPFPTVIAQITPAELEHLRGANALPPEWNIDHVKPIKRPA